MPPQFPRKDRLPPLDLKTLITYGTLFFGVVGGGISIGYAFSEIRGNDREAKEWQSRHDELHRDRLKATSEEKARTDQRLAQLELETRKIENLTYRITVAEQAGLNTGRAIEMLSKTINEQQTDIRVIREILDRQFGTTNQSRRRP